MQMVCCSNSLGGHEQAMQGSLKEPSLSDDNDDDIKSQGSSDVDIQSAEEEDDDYEA